MTPEQEADLIAGMRDAIAAAWGKDRITKKTYVTAETKERRRFDACARAALAIVEPVIRDEAFEEAALIASAGITQDHNGYGSTTRPKNTFEISENIRSLKSKGQKP
jgi:hypothetical protein